MLFVALGVVLSCLLLWLVALPLITLGHEMGHALAALWLTDRPVRLYVGRAPGTFAWRRGRLTCEVRWPTAGFGRVDIVGITKVQRNHLGWIALAGPAASLVMLALGLLTRAGLPEMSPFWRFSTLGVLSMIGLQFCVSTIPFHHPRWWPKRSDTRRAWRHFRKAELDEKDFSC